MGHGCEVITIQQLKTGMVGCAEDECASTDTGVQRSKINKKIHYGDEVVGWATYSCSDL